MVVLDWELFPEGWLGSLKSDLRTPIDNLTGHLLAAMALTPLTLYTASLGSHNSTSKRILLIRHALPSVSLSLTNLLSSFLSIQGVRSGGIQEIS